MGRNRLRLYAVVVRLIAARPRRAIPALLLVALAACTFTAQAAESFTEGIDYQRLPGVVKTMPGERIEVVEFFMYSCEHCLVFEPLLQAWEKQLDTAVALRRIPVPLGATGRQHARIFYTAQKLGVLPAIHAAAFNAVQIQKQALKTEAQIRELFLANGVGADEFSRVFTSPDIDRKITQGAILAQLYGVTSVPSIGVAGRFGLNAWQAKTYQRFLAITDYLVDTKR